MLYSNSLQEKLDKARALALNIRDATDSPSEKAALLKVVTQLNAIEALFQTYSNDISQVTTLTDSGTKRRDEVVENLRKTNAELGTELDNLARLIDRRIQNLNEETASARVRATFVSITLAGLGFLLSVGLIAAILYALHPIGRLTKQIQRLSRGDYSGRVEVKGTDEVALLAEAFNQMVRAVEHRDATLVERAEELNRLSTYLGSVLDSLEDSLLVVEDGQVTLTNPAAKQQWRAETNAPVPAPLEELERSPGRYTLGDVHSQLHEVRVTPFGDHGQVIVTADVTEETRDKEKLARSERLALIGQMLAQITHEVRNPLNALSLNVELLSDELASLDPQKTTESWDLFETVSREIERLTSVTGHYLQLARRPPAQLALFQVNNIVEEIHHLLSAELQQQGVTMTLEQETIEPLLVDGNQLRQALLNIVRNATEAGAKTLLLRLYQQGSDLALSLTDDAGGMSDEQIARAFDPFYSTKATGTGLGLAITRQILEDHGGSIRVESTIGQGTTIVLVIPKRHQEESNDHAQPAEHLSR